MSPLTGESFVVEEVEDAQLNARCREQDARAKRNSDWLCTHWPDLLPGVRGRFVAVAGEEAFIADSSEEAMAMATNAHPGDDGVLLQYVLQAEGPRIYDHRR